MPRLPPRSTLFPTRRSSDLSTFQIYLKIHASRGVGTMVVKISDLKKQLMTRIDKSDLIQVEKVDRYIQHIESRSEEHTSELQSRGHLVCRLLLEKKKNKKRT